MVVDRKIPKLYSILHLMQLESLLQLILQAVCWVHPGAHPGGNAQEGQGTYIYVIDHKTLYFVNLFLNDLQYLESHRAFRNFLLGLVSLKF